MYHLFIDESGELGFGPGSSRHFVITIVSTENVKALNRCMKRETARLVRRGWPKDLEIKGASLWRCDRDPTVPPELAKDRVTILNNILGAICGCNVRVHYTVINKQKLADRLKTAPYGIAYNYFAAQLICRAYHKYYPGPLAITIDQRSKETHHKMKFDGYVEGQLFAECEHGHALLISHAESHAVRGLQAVDLVSWAIFRKYEHGDQRFRDLLVGKLGYRDDWYSWKK